MQSSAQLIRREASLSAVAVRELYSVGAPVWSRWVESHSGATPFHSIAWMRALESSFGYEPRYLCSERDGKLTGVLPLFLVSNPIVGRCLMSTPFADYGGLCTEDEDSADALVERAKEIAREERVDFLELRHKRCKQYHGFVPKQLYVGFDCDLPEDSEAALRKLPRDTRYMIRKGEKAGLELRSGVEGQLGIFYKLFAMNWRRFGTPVFAKAWLATLVQEFHDSLDLKVVYHRNQPVAGVLSLTCGDGIFPHYAGASNEANALAANNFMYWELMKDAACKGFRYFDFGRSKRETGAFKFKSSWNMRTATLDYQTLLVEGKKVLNISPTNRKFAVAMRMWSHLPLPVTTWLGPRVVQWFP